jgi:putative ABC transport system permease protein
MNSEIKPNLLNPRWKKVFSDLWNDKTRTGLVVASIAAGAFAIGMVISSYVILKSDINPSFAAVNPPNIEIWTAPFDQDLVQSLDKISGVDEVQGRRLLEIRARRGTENWQSLTLVGVSDFKGGINQLAPIEGSGYPDNGEIIVSQDLIHTTGFRASDEIEIELPDGSKQNLKVVGLVTDQTASKPDVNSANNAFITMKTLRSFDQGDYFNQLYVTVVGDGSNPELIAAVADSIKDKVEETQRPVYLVEENLSNEHPMTAMILAVIGVLGVLGGLITILSSSLIVNTLNALLTQQLRQIGIMKLVGASSTQILGMYLTLIVAYSLIALVLAVPLGALAGYGLAWLVGTLLGAVMGEFRFIPLAVIAQVLIAILIPLGASYFPVNNGVRTHVQQAISNSRPDNQPAKRNTFNLNARWFAWIPRPILISFRNTFRKRSRLLLTIFTLTVAGSIFIAVFNVRDSMGSMMNQVMMHFLGDVTVTFRQPYKVSKMKRDFPGDTRGKRCGSLGWHYWRYLG